MIFIGVTGGIGSGKSLVCSLFTQKNAPVFYADEVAKKILTTESTSKKIVATFGKQILDESGKPDKKKLADMVFSDQEKLLQLNSIIHPKVFSEFDSWMSQRDERFNYGLVEAALIFESSMDEKLDYVLSVIADKKIRIQRVMLRDRSTEHDVKSRMKHQLADEELMERSDFILYNNKSPEDLAAQINFFHTLFSTLKQPKVSE